jgi:transposase-like protein
MNEESLRKMAVQQYLRGRSPVSIYHEMERSIKWFFKWLRRYQSGNPEWYRDHSKAPHSHSHQTPTEIQNIVKNTRIHLEPRSQSLCPGRSLPPNGNAKGLREQSLPTVFGDCSQTLSLSGD